MSANEEIVRGVRLGYRPELDGLRAVAVVMVVTYHLLAKLPGAFLGVDFFFLLSGFLITRLLLEQRQRIGRIQLGAFYLRRVARLLPALMVVCGATVLVATFDSRGASLGDTAKGVGVTLTYSANWAYAFGARLPLAHMWSLSVEEQFYVVWPLVLIALLAFGGVKLARRGAAIVIAVSAIEMLVRFQQGVPFEALYCGTDGQGTVFLIGGCLLAMTIVTVPTDLARSVIGRTARFLVLPAVAGLLLLVAGRGWGDAFYYRGGYVIVAVMMASILVVSLSGGALTSVLRSRPLVTIGRISYGIYLWHVPIRVWVHDAVPNLTTHPAALITVILALLCATASYHLIEMPIRKWGASKIDRRLPRTVIIDRIASANPAVPAESPTDTQPSALTVSSIP